MCGTHAELDGGYDTTEVILFTPKHRVLKHVSVKVDAFDIRSVPIVSLNMAL